MPRAITASKAFTPGAIGDHELHNRFIRAGCFESMSQGGRVTPALIEHHRRVAAGGAAMTTVAYCSVSPNGRAFDHELWMREEMSGRLGGAKAGGSALWVSSSVWYNGSPASLPEKAGIQPIVRS
jgi:hypothetical protein